MTATAFLAGINYSTQRCQPGLCSSSFLVAHEKSTSDQPGNASAAKLAFFVQGGAPVR